MKKDQLTLEKISNVTNSIRWTELRSLFDKLEIRYKHGSKHSIKAYIGKDVWTMHCVRGLIETGSVGILKKIMIKNNYLES